MLCKMFRSSKLIKVELVTRGRVACVLTVLGESLLIEEYDFE